MRLSSIDSRWQVIFVCGRQTLAPFFVLRNHCECRRLPRDNESRILMEVFKLKSNAHDLCNRRGVK
jgi:hypothetical protein